MAFPLAAADFWERLTFASRPEFVPLHYRAQSLDGAGNFRSSIRGKPKWSVSPTLEGGWHNRNLMQEVDIARLSGLDATFLAYDLRRPFPASDVDGSILGNVTVQIKSIDRPNRALSLKGLTKWFVVTKGDMQSVLYSSTKYFSFEIAETVMADLNGETEEFEVWPYIPDGVAVDDVVTLRKGCTKFKILADSYRPASGVGNFAAGISFTAISVP